MKSDKIIFLRFPLGAIALSSCLLLTCVWQVHAQTLRDPTRPADAKVQGAVDASGPVLQSVMISQTRKTAIISGQTVRVGDRVGDATVVKISEGEVVLRGSGGQQVLKLFPAVEKRKSSSPKDRYPDNRK